MDSQEEEIVITEELTESTIDSKEAEQLKILIPIFCDLYKDSYYTSFIAEMIKRQYMLKMAVCDIELTIIQYYVNGKI